MMNSHPRSKIYHKHCQVSSIGVWGQWVSHASHTCHHTEPEPLLSLGEATFHLGSAGNALIVSQSPNPEFLDSTPSVSPRVLCDVRIDPPGSCFFL